MFKDAVTSSFHKIFEIKSNLKDAFIFVHMKILMVCLGNICRSPLAEGILKEKVKNAGLNWEVDSAGTSHYQSGCAPHELSQKIAKAKGIDICAQQCRQFTKADMEKFDKIYVMDKQNYIDVKKISADKWNAKKVDLLLNLVYPHQNKSVPDPYYGVEKDYHLVYEMIEKACDKIIKAPALKGEESDNVYKRN